MRQVAEGPSVESQFGFPDWRRSYSRFATLGSTTVRQQNDEEQLAQWSFDRVRETNKPEGNGRCPKLLRFECADLDMVKGGHEVGSDLSRLFLGDSVGGILLPGLEDVLQCAAILGRATIPEQLHDEHWGRQHD